MLTLSVDKLSHLSQLSQLLHSSIAVIASLGVTEVKPPWRVIEVEVILPFRFEVIIIRVLLPIRTSSVFVGAVLSRLPSASEKQEEVMFEFMIFGLRSGSVSLTVSFRFLAM